MYRSLCWRASRFEDLGLDGHVEGGGGLVGEEDLRAAGQRDGDGHALAHPARQLVRVFAEALLRLGDADRLQQGEGRLLRLLAVHLEVVDQRLGDLAADLHDRVERGHRVLEDHRHLRAPDRAHLLLGVSGDVGALVVHVAVADHVALGQQPHDRAGQDRLARARLAHDAEGLAAVEAEGHAVHRSHGSPLGQEVRLEVDDAQQLVAGVDASGGAPGDDLAAHRPPSLTSRNSRTRSPARLRDRTVMNRIAAGIMEM